MKGHDWADVLALVFVLAFILLMVRPGSKAPEIIRLLGEAFGKIISFATGPPPNG